LIERRFRVRLQNIRRDGGAVRSGRVDDTALNIAQSLPGQQLRREGRPAP